MITLLTIAIAAYTVIGIVNGLLALRKPKIVIIDSVSELWQQMIKSKIPSE